MRPGAPARSEAPPSELARLVETETRLDRSLAEARVRTAAAVAAAHGRAVTAGAALELELARAHAHAVEAIAATTQRQLQELADATRTRTARYDALRDVHLEPLAHRLAELLARIAVEEAT